MVVASSRACRAVVAAAAATSWVSRRDMHRLETAERGVCVRVVEGVERLVGLDDELERVPRVVLHGDEEQVRGGAPGERDVDPVRVPVIELAAIGVEAGIGGVDGHDALLGVGFLVIGTLSAGRTPGSPAGWCVVVRLALPVQGGGAYRDLGTHARPLTRWGRDHQRPVERGDAVCQTSEAGASGRI